jgi:hypothetical protein
MRIIDAPMQIARPVEMTAARARDMQQTGLQTGTLNEINRDTEEDLRMVRDKSEIEGKLVRTDDDGGNNAGQEQAKKEQDEAPPATEEEALRRRASDRLLNLPVTKRKDAEVETKRFDIRV